MVSSDPALSTMTDIELRSYREHSHSDATDLAQLRTIPKLIHELAEVTTARLAGLEHGPVMLGDYELPAYAICDHLRGIDGALEKYQAKVWGDFEGYLETRTEHYRQEQRWPESPFWRPPETLGRARTAGCGQLQWTLAIEGRG